MIEPNFYPVRPNHKFRGHWVLELTKVGVRKRRCMTCGQPTVTFGYFKTDLSPKCDECYEIKVNRRLK